MTLELRTTVEPFEDGSQHHGMISSASVRVRGATGTFVPSGKVCQLVAPTTDARASSSYFARSDLTSGNGGMSYPA